MHYPLARATSWNLAGYLYLIVASLIATPIFIHALGIDLYGQYLLLMGVIGFASAIDLGLSQAVVRALSQGSGSAVSDRSSLWTTSLLLFTLTGLLAGFLSILVISFFHLSFALLLTIFLIITFNNLLSHFLTLPQSLGRFGWFNVKTFLVGTTATLLTALLAFFGFGLLGIFFAQLLSYLVTLLLLICFSFRFFPFSRYTLPSWQSARPLLSFGWRNQVGKLIGQTGAQYGKFMLAAISPLAVSAYSLSQALVMKAASSINQLTTALYPASSRDAHQPAIRSLYHRLQIGLLVFSLLGVILFYTLGNLVLTTWLHDPSLVVAVHSVLSIFIWYFVILILTPLPSTILDSHGHPGITSFFTFLTVGLEICLAFYFLPRLGMLAPPIAGLIAVAATTPPLLLVTERVLLEK